MQCLSHHLQRGLGLGLGLGLEKTIVLYILPSSQAPKLISHLGDVGKLWTSLFGLAKPMADPPSEAVKPKVNSSKKEFIWGGSVEAIARKSDIPILPREL